MTFTVVAHLFSALLDFFSLFARSGRENDLEILLLRQRLRILQRTRTRPPRLSWWEKVPLAILAGKLVQEATHSRVRLSQSLVLFTPETVLGWHRELVRRKWTFRHQPTAGRPRIVAELEALIVRLARENPRWGYGKIEGELRKLGYRVGRSTIRDVFKRQHIPPAPQRVRQNSTWRVFLRRQHHHLLACDFFTAETPCLQTLSVLFFIELGTRRVHLAGCTAKPPAQWAMQQARQLIWKLQEEGLVMRFRLQDRASKFPVAFDVVLASEGVEAIPTPYRTPNAKAYAGGGSAACGRNAWITCWSSMNATWNMSCMNTTSSIIGLAPIKALISRSPKQHPSTQGKAWCGVGTCLRGLIHDYYRDAASELVEPGMGFSHNTSTMRAVGP